MALLDLQTMESDEQTDGGANSTLSLLSCISAASVTAVSLTSPRSHGSGRFPIPSGEGPPGASHGVELLRAATRHSWRPLRGHPSPRPVP